MARSVSRAAAPGRQPPGRSAGAGPDPVALAQLWADQFQHLTTLNVAGAGGLLVLLQAGMVETGRGWWIALACFTLAAVLAMMGQITVVDEATAGDAPGRRPRTLRLLSVALLGMAGGSVVSLLT